MTVEVISPNNHIISNKNKNNKKFAAKLTPQSYLKTLYDDVPVRGKNKKIKMTEENFIIPEYGEEDMLIRFNFNVQQLKKICRFYKLTLSGNKPVLIHRIYNYLKFSSAAILIQKVFRRHLITMYFKLKGGEYVFPGKRKDCVNPSDFITLDDVEDIPFTQFIAITDASNTHVYGFDICSLYNYVMKNKNKTCNPYNRELFKTTLIKDIRRIFKLSKVLKIECRIEIDKSDMDTLSDEEQLKLRVVSVFQSMDQLGNYTDSSWFLNLNVNQIVKFLRELTDIWFHRANISIQVQNNIYPVMGNPFRNLPNVGGNFACYLNRNHSNNSFHIRQTALTIIERMVTSGLTNDFKYLGTSYVLAALTLVSEPAATAMPWLFQSVV